MAALGSNLRIALRRLSQRPGRTAVVLATLALGVAGPTAMLTVGEGLLWKPLRFRAPGELVMVWDRDRRENGSEAPSNVGFATFVDWKSRSRSFSDLAAMSYWSPTALSGSSAAASASSTSLAEPAERLEGLRVSPSFFSLLGAEPIFGRGFLAEEGVRGQHHVVVLTHGLWQRRFGSDADIIGRLIRFDGAEMRVVGVLPQSFESVFSPRGMAKAEIFGPLAYNDTLPWACRTCRHLRVIGRLAPGVTPAMAGEEIDAVGRALAVEHPGDYAVGGAIVEGLQESLFGPQRPLLLGLLAAVGFVLLMATANVASLLIAAGVPRQNEMAIRSALGARPRDVTRLLVVEGAVVGLAGASLGALLAWGLVRLAVAWAPANLPRIGDVALDARGLAIAAILGVVCAVSASLAPLRSLRPLRRASGISKTVSGERSTRGHRSLFALVALDVALGIVLVAGASLLGSSLFRLLGQEPGFRSDRLLTMKLSVSGARGESAELTSAFYDQLVERLTSLPAVESAAVATQLPLGGDFDRYGVHPEGMGNANPALDPSADRYGVTPSLIGTLGIPLLAGRDFTAADRADSEPVVLVSTALQRRVWGAGEGVALDKRVRIGGSDGPWRRVVGVVGDLRHQGLEATSDGAIYHPIAQWPDALSLTTVAIRASVEPLSLAEPVRALIRELDRDAALSQVSSMDDLLASTAGPRRFAARLVSGFAFVALLLAMLGVYGGVAQAMGQRRREMGVRRVLGATSTDVLRLVFRRVLSVAAIGTVLGVAGAIAFGHALRSLLYGVSITEPSALAAGTGALLLVVLAATLVPALAAARIEPAEVIREEG